MSSNRSDVRDFLVSRRAKITPQQAGLTLFGGNRRVPGLRREEVAMLAGLSTDYYTRLEKGNIAGASETVLHAISDALHLDEAERAHLFDLARAANASPRAPRRRRPQAVRPGIQRLLDAINDAPAFVRNGRLDILATNPLARALYAPVFDSPTRVPGTPPNLARFRFLDPASRHFFPNWEESANTPVQILRTEAGRDPSNKDLTELVGELSTPFRGPGAQRRRWSQLDHLHGRARIAVVGRFAAAGQLGRHQPRCTGNHLTGTTAKEGARGWARGGIGAPQRESRRRGANP